MSTFATALAYSTDSAGMNPAHTLPIKLRAIAEAGFQQVEIGFPDLEEYASRAIPGYKKLDNTGKGDLYNLLKTAKEVQELCRELGLKVLVVHPFSEFEGYEDENKRKENMERARAWFKVLAALDCQMLQVGSSDDPTSSPHYDVIAQDFRVLADEAAAHDPPIKIAYEMWAWGSHINTWEHTWEIAARAYADPTSPGGVLLVAHERLADSLTALSKTIPQEKIFYFQISDGSHKHGVDALIESARKQGIAPLYAWSNAWRPVPFQDEIEGQKEQEGYGGYLPVVDICEAVVKTGWRGPWSFEVFYETDMSRDDPEVPKRWARSAKSSYDKIAETLRERGL